MKITEVRIKLMEDSEDRLRGFCSVTFDDSFVVRDLKIIEGNNGPFVAMPSRKLTSHCPKCRTKNHLRAKYCNQCGAKQKPEDLAYDSDGRAKLYADIAHPVNARCREMIQSRVIEELKKEIELSSSPGYVSRYDDDYDLKNKQRRGSSGHRRGPSSDSGNPAGKKQNPPNGDSKTVAGPQTPGENPNADTSKTASSPGKPEHESAGSRPVDSDSNDGARIDPGSDNLQPPHSGNLDRPAPVESPRTQSDQGSQVPEKSSPEPPPNRPPENHSNHGAGNPGDRTRSFPDEFGKGVFD